MLAAFGGSADASETYICADGPTLTITSKNHDRLTNASCVRQWRASEPSGEGITPLIADDRAGRSRGTLEHFPLGSIQRKALQPFVCRIFCTKPVPTLVENALARRRGETSAEFGARLQHKLAVGRDSGDSRWIRAPH